MLYSSQCFSRCAGDEQETRFRRTLLFENRVHIFYLKKKEEVWGNWSELSCGPAKSGQAAFPGVATSGCWVVIPVEDGPPSL